jgi:hypothetical protein
MNKAPVVKLFISVTMRRFFSVLAFVFLINSGFSQDISTLVKLNDLCVQLGSSRKMPVDSLQLQSGLYKINMKVTLHLNLLLKAAECYISKDYEHSDYYIQQVHMNFRNMEYNNLKFLLITCNYIHAGDVKNSARFYYIISRINKMEPGSMEIIYREIAANLKRDSFDEELSHYFYYHQRLKILDTVYNTRVAYNQ